MIISDLSYLEDVSQELSHKTASGGRAAVYRNNNYVGVLGIFQRGSARLSKNANNKVSSITITPGEIWQVCTRPNYKGRCVLIDKNYRDIDEAGLPNDTMSSIRKV